jgi:pimeloyl-ACP methyl ester carboxylesterase
MLHGLPTDHRHMMSDMEPLFEHRTGWKRIYPDLPGMGKTPGPDWINHQDQMLDVVLTFVDKVIPEQRFAVAGTSYGGYMARGVVYRRAAWISGVLLTVPVIRAKSDQRDLPPQTTLVQDAALISEMEPDEARDFQEVAVVQSRKLLTAIRVNISPAVKIADQKFLDRVRENYAFSFDVDVLPEPFTGPTLILAGRQDSWCGYKDAWGILENYPRGTFVVLDRAGHGLCSEQESLFRALVSEWLDRVEEKE